MKYRLVATFGRFILVGTTCALIFFCLHYLLLSVGQLSLLASLFITYASCFGIGYLLQRNLTFRSESSYRHSLPRYFVLHSVGLAFVYFGTSSLASQFPNNPLAPSLITTALAGAASFAISLSWVFRPDHG
ncbi:MAG: GtrA family protein [Gammaproteobacteria bacterium]